MKQLYLILTILIFQTSNAQDPRLFENDWYLQKVIVDGNDNIPPSNYEVPYITILLLENDFFVNTHVCNYLEGDLIYDSSQFTFNNWTVTLGGCVVGENTDFEQLYLNDFFMANIDNPFNYTVIDESNNTKKLIVTNFSNNQAVYSNQLLSDEEFEKNQFAIYPNPSKNELFLSSKGSPENLKIKIFNIEGQLLNSQNIEFDKKSSIDISKLSHGIYFLNIENGKGKIETKKFIKE